jgi:hypothetical protein
VPSFFNARLQFWPASTDTISDSPITWVGSALYKTSEYPNCPLELKPQAQTGFVAALTGVVKARMVARITRVNTEHVMGNIFVLYASLKPGIFFTSMLTVGRY